MRQSVQANGRPQPVDAKLQRDAESLFLGREGGHLTYALYGTPAFRGDPVCGARMWKQLQHHPDYYLSREEDKLLTIVTKDLARANLGVEMLVDLGPGDARSLAAKTVPLVNALRVKGYSAWDMTDYARAAAQFIQKACVIETQHCELDFFKDLVPKQDRKALFLIAGSTLTNISVGLNTKNSILPLSHQLNRFRQAVQVGSYALVGLDCNPEEKTINNAYQNKPNRRMTEDAMYLIARDTTLRFNPKIFKYFGEWRQEEHRYAHQVVAQERCALQIHGNEIVLESGTPLHVDNSYKFPIDFFADAAGNAGWDVANVWTQTGRIHCALLAARP